MSALVGALRVVLGVNSAQYETGMSRAGRTARSTGAEISRSLASAQRVAVNAFRGIAAAAGVVGIAGASRTFAHYVDAAKQLEAQLRLATRETGNFSQAQHDVRRIAQASRSDIEAVGNLYATIQRNAAQLNLTQAQTARVTETITKAFQISGATAAEAAGGLRQFLQGLQSGTLRGEELNSVLENAPRLARALADGLGVTVGQLREMGAQGQLTGAQVTQALMSAGDAIDAEFAQIPVTFDQAMTQVRNAAVVAFGAFDRGGEFSDALINFAGTGELSFAQIERAAFSTGEDIRRIFAGLSDVFGPMGEGATNVFDYIREQARLLRESIATDLMAAQRAANDVQNLLGARFDLRTMSMVYPEQFTFGDRFREGSAPRAEPWWATASQRPWWMTPRVDAPRPPAPPTLAGGGGGGRRGRAPRPLTRGDLYDMPISAVPYGQESLDQMAQDAARLAAELPDVASSIEDIASYPIPDLGNMLTREDREDILRFAEDFRRDISSGLAQAIVQGRNLGDVLVDAFKRAAAAALEQGIFQLLNGQSFGGKQGAGGFLSFIGSAFGATFAPGTSVGKSTGFVPKFASGGSFTVGGVPGVDRNMLSLNGVPVARVSKGETVGVSPGGGGGKVEIVLRDEMLDARIASGAGVIVTRAYPAMRADTAAYVREQGRRGR